MVQDTATIFVTQGRNHSNRETSGSSNTIQTSLGGMPQSICRSAQVGTTLAHQPICRPSGHKDGAINKEDKPAVTETVNENEGHSKILGLNVCGLRSKLSNGYFDEYAKEFDILCLSETKMTNNSEIDFGSVLNDYFCYTKEKKITGHKHGGVHGLCMLVKNNIVNHSKLMTNVQSPYEHGT